MEKEENYFIKEFCEGELNESLKFKDEIKDDHSFDSIKKETCVNDTDSINDEVL